MGNKKIPVYTERQANFLSTMRKNAHEDDGVFFVVALSTICDGITKTDIKKFIDDGMLIDTGQVVGPHNAKKYKISMDKIFNVQGEPEKEIPKVKTAEKPKKSSRKKKMRLLKKLRKKAGKKTKKGKMLKSIIADLK